MKLLPLLVIVGPTAVGKTDIGIKLAKKLSGEIISADSMQVYKDLNIGTAKITPLEMEGIPHHLIDIKEPWESFSVAEFQQLVEEKIVDINQRKHLPVLVGGTGLYVNSVIYNKYNFTPTSEIGNIRKKYQEVVDNVGTETIHRELAKVDPISAEKIHPNDAKRIIRALEVYHTTGRPISSFANDKGSDKYNLALIGLNMDRKLLYERINRRVDLMLEKGWLKEVQDLLNRGVPQDSPALQGLGYKQLIMYLNKEISYEKAVEIIKRETRRYAKRQITWFKRENQIQWIDVTNKSKDEIILEILPSICRKFQREVE